MISLFPICTVCKEKCGNSQIISYFKQSPNGGMTTKACCMPCSNITNDKWLENGWKKNAMD